MKKSFAVVMALALMLGSILPAAQPVSTTKAVLAYAPSPTPPTPLHIEPNTANLTPPPPPSPGALSTKVEDARARQAIEAVLEKYLRYWGPRYRVAPVEVTVEGEWAHGVARWRSEAKTLKEPIHILAHRLPDGTWQALMPSTDGLYLRWLDGMPESLVPVDEKSQLRMQAAEAAATRRPRAIPIVPPATISTPAPTKIAAEPQADGEKPPLTQGWQVYSNEKLGLSILYPDGWFVHEVERSPDAGVLVDFTPVPARKPGQVVPSLWIEVISKPAMLGLNDWIEIYVLQNLPTQVRSSVTILPYHLVDSQGFEIDGLPGVYRNLQYFFATSKRIYRVTISPYEPENPNFKEVMSDIRRLWGIMLPSLHISD
ncbi:MAG: hypothetical protein DRI80_05940 [Chloroflexota bacterium]|nr:MAG: hypothetical protein DRI80_05940 [Chloroflexota bacterium]